MEFGDTDTNDSDNYSDSEYVQPKRKAKRKIYTCRKCGLPKKGHTCIVPLTSDEEEDKPLTSRSKRATANSGSVTATTSSAPTATTNSAPTGSAPAGSAPAVTTSSSAPVTATSVPVTATSSSAPVTATSSSAPVTATSAPVTTTSSSTVAATSSSAVTNPREWVQISKHISPMSKVEPVKVPLGTFYFEDGSTFDKQVYIPTNQWAACDQNTIKQLNDHMKSYPYPMIPPLLKLHIRNADYVFDIPKMIQVRQSSSSSGQPLGYIRRIRTEAGYEFECPTEIWHQPKPVPTVPANVPSNAPANATSSAPANAPRKPLQPTPSVIPTPLPAPPPGPNKTLQTWSKYAAGCYCENSVKQFFMDRQNDQPATVPKIRVETATMVINEKTINAFDTSGHLDMDAFQAFNAKTDTFLFHGCNAYSAVSIQSSGLLLSYATNGNLNVGLYGAIDPRKSLTYCGGGANNNYMFLCRYRFDNTTRKGKFGSQEPTYDEFAVYNEKHVVVLWMLKIA